ncbi:radical SAM family heme chaperone HemW [Allohahella marinimesophila]|uniref:Heme chaperone HemW n=1 Tax=Allohahella marinimesophila TaxID=1054972 RepID=A0ABP7PCY4_9GAMM
MHPPLSLYVHVPWCIRKCPYCDFNSHETNNLQSQIEPYLDALLLDWSEELERLERFGGRRPLQSIFIGGGTPSLLPPDVYARLLERINDTMPLMEATEITLEANPGAVDTAHFKGYRRAGINRISVGVQSFATEQLAALGRVHSGRQALEAIEAVASAGFERFNIDLMFGLPQQTAEGAEADLRQALQCGATHLSWYQLTLEPNTHFFSHPPPLPEDDDIADIQLAGQVLLAEAGLQQYEVSAYARRGQAARHNRNYWEFGDYLAIGAGAHGKLSSPEASEFIRYRKTRQPDAYLKRAQGHGQLIATSAAGFLAAEEAITQDSLSFEFMLNALRLTDGVPVSLFTERTGLAAAQLEPTLSQLKQAGLMQASEDYLQTTPLGARFLNDVVGKFSGW